MARKHHLSTRLAALEVEVAEFAADCKRFAETQQQRAQDLKDAKNAARRGKDGPR